MSGTRHQNDGVKLEEDEFGTYVDEDTGNTLSVRRFTWRNSTGISVQVISYGATITSIKMPDKAGRIDDIVLGFDDIDGYLSSDNPYFGATIGRVANRIANATFTIDGQNYHVTANEGRNTLHGGLKGFDKRNWNQYIDGNKLRLTYLSKDTEEGFPGDVLTTATFELTEDNRFLYEYLAVCSKPTYINLTNHSYINLAGHQSGAKEIYNHLISINADEITEVNCESIPTGKILPVADTVFDLRIPKVIGDVIDKVPGSPGFDHNFCISKGSSQDSAFIARVVHPSTGRMLEVYSNQPGVQFYTANGLPEKSKKFEGDSKQPKVTGKGGAQYFKHGAFCLEAENYPDAINHKNFPSGVLYPGQLYHRTIEYRFFVD